MATPQERIPQEDDRQESMAEFFRARRKARGGAVAPAAPAAPRQQDAAESMADFFRGRRAKRQGLEPEPATIDEPTSLLDRARGAVEKVKGLTEGLMRGEAQESTAVAIPTVEPTPEPVRPRPAIRETTAVRAPPARPQERGERGDLVLGLLQAEGQTLATAGEILQAVGVKGTGKRLEEVGERRLQQAGPLPSIREDPFGFAVRTAPPGIISTLPALGGAAAGAYIGTAIFPFIGTAVGAGIGAYVPAYAMSFAELRDELEEEGLTGARLEAASAIGAIIPAALEMILPVRLVTKRAGAQIRRTGAKLALNVMRQGGIGALIEASEEFAQDIVKEFETAIVTKQVDEFDLVETVKRAFVSGAAALVPGALFGGFVGFNTGRQVNQQRVPSVPSPDPAVEAATVEKVLAALAHPEQTVELGQAVEGPTGVSSGVKNADGSEYRIRYQVVEADDIVTSHDPETFQVNSAYPEKVQERRYHAVKTDQEAVVQTAQGLDPPRVLDLTIAPTNGPPILRADGIALSGNQRTMGIKRAYAGVPERADAYKGAVADAAEKVGVERGAVEAMRQPVLVRVLTDDNIDLSNRAVLAEVVSRFNEDATKARDPLAEAATAARRFRKFEAGLQHFSETIDPDQTVRSYLETAAGKEFMRMLTVEGTMPSAQRARYIDSEGNSTDEGKTFVERMMQLAAIGDPEVVARAPDGVLQQLEYSYPAIISASNVRGFDLQASVNEALDLLAFVRGSKEITTVAAYVNQRDAFDAVSPEAIRLAEFLESANKKETTAAFRKYADLAAAFQQQTTSDDLFGAVPMGRDRVFGKVFGAEVAADLEAEPTPKDDEAAVQRAQRAAERMAELEDVSDEEPHDLRFDEEVVEMRFEATGDLELDRQAMKELNEASGVLATQAAIDLASDELIQLRNVTGTGNLGKVLVGDVQQTIQSLEVDTALGPDRRPIEESVEEFDPETGEPTPEPAETPTFDGPAASVAASDVVRQESLGDLVPPEDAAADNVEQGTLIESSLLAEGMERARNIIEQLGPVIRNSPELLSDDQKLAYREAWDLLQRQAGAEAIGADEMATRARLEGEDEALRGDETPMLGGFSDEQISSFVDPQANYEASVTGVSGALREAQTILGEGVQTPDIGAPTGMVPKLGGPDGRVEIEEAYQAAKGLPSERLAERLTAFWGKVVRGTRARFRHLPAGARFSKVRDRLLLMENRQPTHGATTVRIMADELRLLGPVDMELFTKFVYLSDLQHSAENAPLPSRYESIDEVKFDLARVTAEIKGNSVVADAIRKRAARQEDIKEQLAASAEALGDNQMRQILSRPDYFRHQVIAHYNTRGAYPGAGRRLEQVTKGKRGFLKRRRGTELDHNTDYLQAEYEVLSGMLQSIEQNRALADVLEDQNVMPGIEREIKQARDELKAFDRFVEQLVEGEQVDLLGLDVPVPTDVPSIDDLVPEGYTKWFPRLGSPFFRAHSIPEGLALEMMEDPLAEFGITAGDLREVLARGRRYKPAVIPIELAKQLDDMPRHSPRGDEFEADFFKVAQRSLNAWKVWQLLSPRRLLRYNLRNLTGDADKTLVGNPRAFRHTIRAAKELRQFMFNKVLLSGQRSLENASPELRAYIETGGLNTLLQMQEMGDINRLDVFLKLEGKHGPKKRIVKQGWARYWRTVRLNTDWREAMLRYANFIEYRSQMLENGGVPRNFGASIPEEVLALDDIDSKAFKLSNELVGAYDQISPIGESLRRYAIPFWSFQELNMRSYYRLLKNAYNDDQLAAHIGRRVVGTAAIKAPYLALRTGKFVLKVHALWGMLQIWNLTFYRDEEDELPDDIRGRPHIILGRDKDGNIRHFTRLGTLGDLLEWVGADQWPLDVVDWLNGRRTAAEVIQDMGRTSFSKMVGGLAPWFTYPPALLTRRNAWPDATRPRTIRDRWEFIAQSLGLGQEYRALRGKPQRHPYFDVATVRDLPFYVTAPDAGGYWDTQDRVRRFLEKQGKAGEGFIITPRGNALYELRRALTYGDRRAVEKYMTEYEQLGGTAEGMTRSLLNLDPLSALTVPEQIVFRETLDSKGKRDLDRAYRHYIRLFQRKGLRKQDLEAGRVRKLSKTARKVARDTSPAVNRQAQPTTGAP